MRRRFWHAYWRPTWRNVEALLGDGRSSASTLKGMTRMMMRRRFVLPGILALALVRAVSSQSAPAPAFPLRASADARYLVDKSGAAFPMLGRASWAVVGATLTDRQTLLNDTVSKGFTAIEVGIPWRHPRGINVPKDGNGDLPFLKRLDGSAWTGALSYSNINNEAPDFTTPNPAYWAYVDSFLAYCASKNILVFMFPAYVGYPNSTQGWMAEVSANGSARMNTYGAWLAARYAQQKNIVWMMGGDDGTFSQAQTDAENGLLTGLK